MMKLRMLTGNNFAPYLTIYLYRNEDDSTGNQLELAALKMMRQRNLYNIYKFQTEGKRYSELAEDRFRPTVEQDKVEQALDEQYSQNKQIEELIMHVATENQMFEPVLVNLINWDNEQ